MAQILKPAGMRRGRVFLWSERDRDETLEPIYRRFREQHESVV